MQSSEAAAHVFRQPIAAGALPFDALAERILRISWL